MALSSQLYAKSNSHIFMNLKMILKSIFQLGTKEVSSQICDVSPRDAIHNLFVEYGATPEILSLDDDDRDLPLLCGREMQVQRLNHQHELVISLGKLLSTLQISHERININLQKSVQAIARINKLKELEDMRCSDQISKKEYESSLVNAWLKDPDCSTYLDLLKKIVIRKLRHDRLYSEASDALKNELVDLQINRRILLVLSNSKEWKFVNTH